MIIIIPTYFIDLLVEIVIGQLPGRMCWHYCRLFVSPLVQQNHFIQKYSLFAFSTLFKNACLTC